MPVPPRTLPPEPGLLAGRGFPLVLPDLDWPRPSPTAWQLGPQPPPQHGFPPPPGKRPPSRQNCLPDPSIGGGPAPSRAKLSPYPDQGLRVP